ncbi:hypothetical protein A6R68_04803 [Neotoma lepida]|uniref:Proheparin-binding EGF-like growth factor n=1 Tax=Neotoma lepida TaxID=56216 RepID=A0A1A6GLA9_NEOLE|nr:hypothetical protein A6R68_04803 [Neotoma lepida]
MKLLPSVVLKLFLAAVLPALVTGDSLERLRRGLAAATKNPDSPTGSTNQLLPTGDGRAQEVQGLEETDPDLFREKSGKKKKKGKGLGKKRDPCLRKYKDFCIHGECKYLKDLRAPSCKYHRRGGYDVENEEKVKGRLPLRPWFITSSTEGKDFESSHEDFFIPSCYPDWASRNCSAKVSEPLSAKQTMPTGIRIRTQWKQESALQAFLIPLHRAHRRVAEWGRYTG